MSKFEISGGRKVKKIDVGVNSSGKYHRVSCRYYSSCDQVMSEKKAVEKGYVCGNCCN